MKTVKPAPTSGGYSSAGSSDDYPTQRPDRPVTTGDFTNIDNAKWLPDKVASSSLKIASSLCSGHVHGAELTLSCSGCGEPVGWIGGAPQTIGHIFHVEFECPCGETTVFYTRGVGA